MNEQNYRKVRLTQRQQQKAKTRERIYVAARKLFRKNGYEDTRSSDISREAGVSHGSLFAHFKSKAELLEHLSHDYLKSQIKRLKTVELGGDSAAERLKSMVTELWKGVFLDKKLSRAVFSQAWLWKEQREIDTETLTGVICQIGVDILHKGQKEGEISPDLDVFLAIAIVQAQYRECLRQALICPEREEKARRMLYEVVDLVCRS